MNILSAKQFYEIDAITAKTQEVSSTDLMERAGIQIFNWLDQKMNGAQVPIHIFCGIGNNGGDGLVLGRLLIEAGYNVFTYVANFTDKRSKDFLINYGRIKTVSKKWPVLMTNEEDFPEIHIDDIIIDALFGIGLNRAPEGWVKKLIQYLNTSKAFKLAVDIPSGLHANAPIEDFDAVLKANHTLTFQAPKMAFFLLETAVYAPSYEVLDIGLDQEYLITKKPLATIFSKKNAQTLFKPRERFANKSDFGHALIVGGSYGKIGAVSLAVKATFRIGVGLVTAYIPKCGYSILQIATPEAMVQTDKEEDLISHIDMEFQPSAIGIGVGLGTHKKTIEALKLLFKEVKAPLVIDADALNCIALDKDLLKLLPENSILTPHPGELKRLIGNWKNDYEKLEKTKKFSKKHKVIVLIKGARTKVLFKDEIFINTTGNAGMATAGSGDVLTGVLTGLLSQGYEPLQAALYGVYLHGSAGDIASGLLGKASLMATDITENLNNAYFVMFEEPKQEKTEVEETENN